MAENGQISSNSSEHEISGQGSEVTATAVAEVPSVGEQGHNRRSSDRRGSDRRQSCVDRRSGLDRRRGPGRRRSEDRRSAEEGEMNEEQFEFLMAMNEYKQVNRKPFPTWTEVLDVLKALGYRKVAEPQDIR